MTVGDSVDDSKPLAYLYGKAADGNTATKAVLERLGLRCEVFMDSGVFLGKLRSAAPDVCLVDLTAPKPEAAVETLRSAVRAVGESLLVLAIIPKGDRKLAALVETIGSTAYVEKPIVEGELAHKLSNQITTDAIAALVVLKTASSDDLPPIVAWLFEKVVPLLLHLKPDTEFFVDSERQIKYYAERLHSYEDQMVALVQHLRRSQEKLDYLQSLRMYGVTNCRNLVATISLVNAGSPNSFSFDAKTLLPSPEPKTVIPYAIRTVTRFGEGSKFYDIAFSAGLVFDLLVLVTNKELGERKRAVQRLLGAAYTDAIRRCEKGFKLGKAVDDLAAAKHIITTIMMRDAGKVAMAMFFETYPDFQKVMKKKKIGHALQMIAEEKNFEIPHNLVGAMLCLSAPNLSEAYPAVLLCDVPGPLHVPSEHDLHALATFCRSL